MAQPPPVIICPMGVEAAAVRRILRGRATLVQTGIDPSLDVDSMLGPAVGMVEHADF